MPNQAGAIWIGLLITFLVYGDSRRPLAKSNLELAALFLLAFLLIDVLTWEGGQAALVFSGIFLTTAAYATWGIVLAYRRTRLEWPVGLPERRLQLLLALLIALNAAVALGRPPDDAGYYTNLGALRWTETGELPYGDERLKGPESPGYGAAATYGPLLYAAHVPVQRLLFVPRNPPDADPKAASYRRPPVIATKLTALAFHLVGLLALFSILNQLASRAAALGVTAVYAASPYVIGLGGDDFVITGLAFVSHIAPAAVTLVAFAFLRRPALSGAILAAAAGVLFYPVFLLPLWLGWWAWRSRSQAARFAAGFAGGAAAIVAFVALFVESPETSVLQLFMESTLEHQEGFGPRQYGASTFSFWGTHPALADFWQSPVIGSSSLFKPAFLAFAAFAVAGFVLARRRTIAQLAGLTAAVAAAVQLWKTHATGTYVEWYMPFLLIALFGAGSLTKQPGDRPANATLQP